MICLLSFWKIKTHLQMVEILIAYYDTKSGIVYW